MTYMHFYHILTIRSKLNLYINYSIVVAKIDIFVAFQYVYIDKDCLILDAAPSLVFLLTIVGSLMTLCHYETS